MRVRRLVQIAGWVVVAAALKPSPVPAQTYGSTITLTARPWTPGSECEPGEPCEEDTGPDELGTYEFRVYGGVDTCVEEAWFGLRWPEAWMLLASGVCQDSLVSGSLDRPEEGFHFRNPSGFEPVTPLLWFVLDCSEPGTCEIYGAPGSVDLSPLTMLCGGVPEENYGRYVRVGDPCSPLIVMPPCGYCWGYLAGGFHPHSLQVSLSSGEIFADTIRVYSADDCSDIPECQTLPYPCFNRIDPQAAWIAMEFLHREGNDRFYCVTIDPKGLDLGTYASKIWLRGSSDCCKDTCMPVALEVLPPESRYPTSWGRVKSLY